MLRMPLHLLWTVDLAFALVAVLLAVSLRPWRALRAGEGPPWAWVMAWGVMPLAWSLDLQPHGALVLPLSLAPLMVLLCGWPLTVLAVVAASVFAGTAGGLAAIDALHRGVWLGLIPATAALAIGAVTRRWLPHHVFVYLLARAWFGSFLACALASMLALAVHEGPGGLLLSDRLLAGLLSAWGEAMLTGMLVTAIVAYRPQWIATYTDRLYLQGAGGR